MVSHTMRQRRGFTLIELLVVLAIIGTLLSVVAPRFVDSVERAKEAALRTDLRVLREAIDKYRADTGKLPQTLAQLAEARYVRAVPVDPVTDRTDTWVAVPAPDGTTPGVFDVRSGAPGTARDGTTFASW
jgi:general secretion pathway protein G